MKNDVLKYIKILSVFIGTIVIIFFIYTFIYFYGSGNTKRIYVFTDGYVSDTMTKSDGYIECTSIFLDKCDNSFIDKNAQIKIRGQSTAGGIKKPYNIKFSKKHDLLDTGESKTWVLLADCYDSTLLRNYLSLKLAKRIGLEYTPECDYIELWVDFKYKGCYLLTDKIATASNSVRIDEEAGDFIIQLEMSRKEDAEYITLENGWRFEIIEPDKPSASQIEDIKFRMKDFSETLISGDFTEIKDSIDLESFSKYYLINEFLKNSDFERHSVYFYYKYGKMYAGPVWDFDLSMGNVRDTHQPAYYSLNEKNEQISYEKLFCDKHIFKELLSYDEYKKIVRDTFETYEDIFINLNSEIDAILKKYGLLFKKNFSEKWLFGAGFDESENYCWDFEKDPYPTYSENVQFLKNWLKNRYIWMKENNVWE